MSDALRLESVRQDALGAFAHEFRTPLTAIRMVIDLGARAEDALTLDAELVSMLESSLGDLNRLADDIHDLSRAERGRFGTSLGSTSVAAAIAAAALLGHGRPAIALEAGGACSLPLDEGRAARLISGLADATNRLGAGSGMVTLRGSPSPPLVLSLTSGTPGGDPIPVTAEAGFGFYAGLAIVEALGGLVTVARSQGACQLTATFPA